MAYVLPVIVVGSVDVERGASAQTWGFAIYRASHDDYDDSVIRTDALVGGKTHSTAQG